MASHARARNKRFSADNVEKKAIRTLIRKIIEPFRSMQEKPPFNLEDLIVMALMEKSRSAESVQRWIFLNFIYYSEMAFRHAWKTTLGSPTDPGHRLINFASHLDKAFRTYDIPLEKVKGDPHILSLDSDEWSVPANQGMVFLRDVIPQREAQMIKKPFRFLDLPPELREKINSIVLSLPKSGVAARSVGANRRMSLLARTRGHDEPFEFADGTQYVYECRPLSVQLALLLCNKQIFQETKHLFYSINTFICDHQFALGEVLRQLAPGRRKHLGHVAFKYDPIGAVDQANIKLLGEIEHLRELDIKIDENVWLARKNRNGTPRYPSVLDIPGIRILRNMRGLKRVNFHGDCEKIKAALEKEMIKPKLRKKVRESRKRKAANESETSEKGKKMKNRLQEGGSG
ncbi:Hypothetical predicted protein [Lecanosticta acicola]|uniref:F-box domain-containing protein n=1 Tax=Lecanosticta acicola TaxID=111012 RepID=A0AAI8YTZ6_9PEZI|nr:Hypothetical predicted protein [Lecanosticta acicola]